MIDLALVVMGGTLPWGVTGSTPGQCSKGRFATTSCAQNTRGSHANRSLTFTFLGASVKIAVIPPTSLLESYGVLGDKYHLCLSHEVLTNVGYAEFYQRRRREGDFVILDNSAHEQLEGQSLDQLVRAAKYVGPSEIVLPDRLFFGDDTIERSTEAFERLREEFPTTRLMGVPQGRTVKEWLVCLDAFLDLGVDTIGISKDYEVWPDGLGALVELVRGAGEQDIHLLGWGRELWQLRELANLVRGVDSAKPVVYALHGVELPDVISPASTPKYPRRQNDFFAGPANGEYPLEFHRIARANIAAFRREAQGGLDARRGVRASQVVGS